MVDTHVSASRTIALHDRLDHDAAVRLHQAIQRAGDRPVMFDASRVETVSLTAIQLITAALKPVSSVMIVNPSPAYRDAFATLGLDCVSTETQMHVPDHAAPHSVGDTPPKDDIEDPSPLRILTIDDSKTMRNMLMLTLSAAGFDVVQAEDGRDGLAVLERERVDVIITDINMPKMDGYGVIEHLRGDPTYDETPILVLTTESDRDKKQRARDLGATGFIVKPFSPETLVNVIHKVAPR